jgi:Flp pilus assembly pilin Flp
MEGGFVRAIAVKLWNLVSQEEGASLVEYAFIVLLMVVVSIAVVASLGEYPASAFESVDGGFGGP